MSDNKELVPIDQVQNKDLVPMSGFNDIGLPNDPKLQLQYLREIAEGQNAGVTSTGDVIMLASMAKEFGMGISAAIRNIHIMKDKKKGTSKMILSYHVLKALLEKYNDIIDYECIMPYGPIYQYITADGLQIPGNNLPSNANIVALAELEQLGGNLLNVAPLPATDAKGNMLGIPLTIDNGITYRFSRLRPVLGQKGKFEVRSIEQSFYLSMAVKQGLWKEAGMWDKRPDIMCEKTCIVEGFRKIASDLAMGMMTNVDFGIDDERMDIDTEG